MGNPANPLFKVHFIICNIIRNFIRKTSPDRSQIWGPRTTKTGPRTDTGPVFARTDPTLHKVSSSIIHTHIRYPHDISNIYSLQFSLPFSLISTYYCIYPFLIVNAYVLFLLIMYCTIIPKC